MELKSYQQTTLDTLGRYLNALNEERAKAEQARAFDIDYDWEAKAWERVTGSRSYTPHVTGAGRRAPMICLKIPTGGGKTLLAARSVDLINTGYRRAQTGLVLWIVPTNAIYRQTHKALRDRAHPYRQILDISSGGRTLILEKDTPFNPTDVEERLAVMLLMLPSANRLNKETLRMFQDRGGFDAFFPPEDQLQRHAELLEQIPNLDTFDAETWMGGRQIKTSLGNVLRLLNPLIVLDEGHKAYSATAQATLMGFNPCFVLELSATPPRESNKLVDISGLELLREGMIKLDMHLNLKATPDWRDTLRAAHARRAELEQTARDYERNGGEYIRPICLVQVERTGEKQRRAGLIHAEDAREFLVKNCMAPPHEIAVKSSERDELEDTDLLSPESAIRYVITRSALQEGWDCPFAYVLAVLPSSEQSASLTQLIGRILRQPYARKTPVDALNESYVYCYRQNSGNAVRAVQAGLVQEGLGDMAGRITLATTTSVTTHNDVFVRSEYQQFVGKVYLPCFVVADGKGSYREFNYQADLLRRIDWDAFDLSRFDTLELNPEYEGDASLRIGLEQAIPGLRATTAPVATLDPVFLTQQMTDVVPNPWVAYDYARDVLARLERRYSPEIIGRNRSFIVDELHKVLDEQLKQLAEDAFRNMIRDNALRFYLIKGVAGAAIPDRIAVRANTPRLVHEDHGPLQRSLFDYEPEDEFNRYERAVALYLDKQQRVLWWYRNIARVGYSVQGWQPHRVFPDFVTMRADLKPDPAQPITESVYVIETKGIHLKNDDTRYKQALFDLCNEHVTPTPWSEIEQEFIDQKVHFQVIFDDEWQRVINALLI
jgi:type III restriction enzyme